MIESGINTKKLIMIKTIKSVQNYASIFLLKIVFSSYNLCIGWNDIKKCLEENPNLDQNGDVINYDNDIANSGSFLQSTVSKNSSVNMNELYCIQIYSGTNRDFAFELYNKHKAIYPELEMSFNKKLYSLRLYKSLTKLELLKKFIEMRKIFTNIIIRECNI